MVRLALLGFVAGVSGVQGWPGPLSLFWLSGLSIALMGVAWACSVHRWSAAIGRLPLGLQLAPLCGVGAAVAAGLAYGSAWASHRLADALEPGNEDKVTRVVLQVAELPRLDADSRVFVADVLSSTPEGVPSRIQVRWNSGKFGGPYGRQLKGGETAVFPELLPGQIWRMALVLRHPHGSRNPDGFDYEGHMFARGIRATGTVRGKPVLLDDQPWTSIPIVAQRARHYVREAMLPHIDHLRWGGVLLALAIGDQASVPADDWLTFNRTGLTHLVSISGSHVTLIASLAALGVNFVWRRLRWKGRAPAERLPAQLAAAGTALVVSWLYCLLAGWGVPARRTFLMLTVIAGSLFLRVPLAPSHVLAVAAFAVVLLDPWSPLSSGFWLSFLAVHVLMASSGWWGNPAGSSTQSRCARWRGQLWVATRLQLAITVALLPPLAMLFNEISIVSPLANAYAIPLLGAIVTPLALLLAGLSLLPAGQWASTQLANATHWLLDLCMVPTLWLSELAGASLAVATPPVWLMALAMAGVAITLLPTGFPFRAWGWALMLPAFVWTPPRPAPGDWVLHALDVGQGTAVVIRTARHVLVYDTGVRYSPDADAGSRTLVPFLRSLGVRHIDSLVVSHADIDHVGGLRSLLEALPVNQSHASFDVRAWLEREGRLLGGRALPPLSLTESGCQYGVHWRVDEVSFEFLWPLGERSIGVYAGTSERNRNACVLRIRGAHHSVLLPGDIGAPEEQALVERGLTPVDVVLAAHHGSRFSSSLAFVEATDPRHAIAQAARWNRYGHPAPSVRKRWQEQGAVFWETGLHGAVTVRSIGGELVVDAERNHRPRYWAPP